MNAMKVLSQFLPEAPPPPPVIEAINKLPEAVMAELDIPKKLIEVPDLKNLPEIEDPALKRSAMRSTIMKSFLI